MARLFDSYIIVDWSAASKPNSGEDSIWIGAQTRDARFKLKFEAANPDTRAKAEAALKAVLQRLTKRGDRVLVGVDFPLGYPRGFADAIKAPGEGPPWQRIHDFLTREMKDRPDNQNNRFALAARMNRLISDGPFPFWGCPKRDVLTTLSMKKTREHGPETLPEWRLSEENMRSINKAKPHSVWKLAYAGAVGGQALTGIPVIHRLATSIGGSAVWPFQTEPLASDHPYNVVFAEVYPSLLSTKPLEAEIKDRAQVRQLSAHYASLDDAGKLAAVFDLPADLNEESRHQVTSEEGWILGI